jgi:UDP-N-acetylglucosamine--N-acetylmuramyl-(pentapeptide) pyrophosphoryl-undecaprenol N-acetylglucosamine transferase
VYPALAVLEALNAERSPFDVLWVGAEGGMEAGLVQRAGIPFRSIPAAGLHGVGLRSLPGNLLRLARGLFTSRRILHEFRPDVLFFTGGYVAVPMSLAGWHLPQLLYIPDIEPGLALKALVRFATRIAVTVDATRRYLPHPDRMVVTGYPTRPGLAGWERAEARAKLGLHPGQPVLLVFGGSKGARSINTALQANLAGLLEKMQVVHISGELDWPVVQAAQASLPEELAGRYHPFAYLHEEMGAALAAADLVVSRAGASSLGEFPLFGLPAILVPYPYAWRYQKVNADYLAERGGALVLEDASLQSELASTVLSLLGDWSRLEKMRMAMQALSTPKAAASIAGQILALTGKA